MKKIALIVCMMTIVSMAKAQNADYRVVFDMTSRDSLNQQAVVRELNLIREGNPDAQLEVVMYGQGIDIAIKGRSSQEPAIQKLLTDKGISFKICAIAMKRNNIDKSQLIPGVEVVPDGIYEIISKQREGWGYIKVAR
jgi:intracellular sulfur oxidation DsrE/DsrF family protein